MPLIIGHRGARGERPENTIEAFRHAQTIGVYAIETDIQMTADLIPVIHHDPELADGRRICSLRLSECPAILTLSETLAALPHMTWLLEIKTYPPHPEKSHPAALIVSHVLAALDAAGTAPPCIAIKAFDWSVLRALAASRPAIRRICLTAPETEKAKAVWWGEKYADATAPQAVAATGAFAWSAFHETLTSDQTAQAKALHLQVFAWTVNEKADFERLAGQVDAIVTDYPSRYIEND